MFVGVIKATRWYVQIPGKKEYAARNAGDALAHIKSAGSILAEEFLDKETKEFTVRTSDGIIECYIIRKGPAQCQTIY